MKHPFDVHVGERIRQSRCSAALSAQVLGVMLGISTAQVQALEAGAVRADAELLRRLVSVLGVPPAHFFEGLERAL